MDDPLSPLRLSPGSSSEPPWMAGQPKRPMPSQPAAQHPADNPGYLSPMESVPSTVADAAAGWPDDRQKRNPYTANGFRFPLNHIDVANNNNNDYDDGGGMNIGPLPPRSAVPFLSSSSSPSLSPSPGLFMTPAPSEELARKPVPAVAPSLADHKNNNAGSSNISINTTTTTTTTTDNNQIHRIPYGPPDEPPHAMWRRITAPTAACDSCDRRGHRVLQRCVVGVCCIQLCGDCARRGDFDTTTHIVDVHSVAWTVPARPAPRSSRRPRRR
ncbi:hypothetical protein SPI_08630 [Niveomyces insectorum RCEF 264]|uniref:Uncharacterized protein n=1 Tax=Niveomyces insectorum RCEF 264 TaxID=1081102 RepID=A0A167MU44_9HYPO|nr:hypothetical protein SPI_08630 [Niveomyces insectorum RCEF 264]